MISLLRRYPDASQKTSTAAHFLTDKLTLCLRQPIGRHCPGRLCISLRPRRAHLVTTDKSHSLHDPISTALPRSYSNGSTLHTHFNCFGLYRAFDIGIW